MPRIDQYTADLSSARGTRGRVAEQISIGAATAPGRALEAAGDALTRAAIPVARLGEIAAQRERENELRWAGDEASSLKDELIQWQSENHTREDYGEAYRKFADDLIDKRGQNAPNTRALEVFKGKVLPTVQSDWEMALRTGEKARLSNFSNSIVAETAKAGEHFRFRNGLGHTEEARDILSSDIAQSLAAIEVTYGKTLPGVATELKEKVVVGGVLSALEADPEFARELLDAHRNVDPQSRAILLGKIEASTKRIGSVELVNRDQARQNLFADAEKNNTPVPPLDLSVEKNLLDPAQYQKLSTGLEQQRTVHNETIKTVDAVAPLNPAARSAKLAEAFAKTEGETGKLVRESLIAVNKKLNEQLKADSMAYVTRYNPEIEDAYNAAVKSGKQSDYDYWQTLAWERQGHPPPHLATAFAVPGNKDPRQLAATYQGLPEAERRLLLKPRAIELGESLTKGGWQERLQAAQQLNVMFPDEQKRAVAIKDIEQLNDGKGPDIQRTLIASKLAEVNPAAAQALLSGAGREAYKTLKPESQKEIGALLSVGRAGTSPSWSLFALAARGANYESQDLVSGFRSAIEEQAALYYQGNATEAVNKALKVLIFDRVAMPVMTPSFGSSPGQPILIGRAKPDGTLRTDAEIASIAQRLPYAKNTIKPDELSLFAPNGEPYYANAVPWLYRPGVKELQKDSKELLQLYIQQRGFWVSDADNQGGTFYMEGENGFNFAPVMKATGKPLRIHYQDLPAVPEPKRVSATGRHEFLMDYGPVIVPREPENIGQFGRE